MVRYRTFQLSGGLGRRVGRRGAPALVRAAGELADPLRAGPETRVIRPLARGVALDALFEALFEAVEAFEALLEALFEALGGKATEGARA